MIVLFPNMWDLARRIEKEINHLNNDIAVISRKEKLNSIASRLRWLADYAERLTK